MCFSKRLGAVLGLILLSLSQVKCSSKSGSSSFSEPSKRVVNLAIWSNYLSSDLIDAFYQKTGIEVQISNYSSNEELLAKMQAGASGYDVAVPSDYMVYVMIHLGLLHRLDFKKVPNFEFVDQKFLKKSYDPQSEYSIPYDWGTTGIAVNRALYSGPIREWKDLFGKPELAGKVSLMDDSREVLGAVLKMHGYSLNSKVPEQLEKAKDVLLKVKKRIKAFTLEPMMPLIGGEIAVAHAYVSDALQARRALKGKIEYVIPEEGSTLWIDNLVIPEGAKHVEEAYAFINFILEAKSSASTAMSVFVASTNKKVFALLPSELQQDVMLFPSAGRLAKCEMIEHLGEFSAFWDRIWTEIKAEND